MEINGRDYRTIVTNSISTGTGILVVGDRPAYNDDDPVHRWSGQVPLTMLTAVKTLLTRTEKLCTSRLVTVLGLRP